MTIDFAQLEQLTGGRFGKIDTACPWCGPEKRTPAKRRKKVLRIWRPDESFAGFHCARCGEGGYVRDGAASAPDPARVAAIRQEQEARERDAAADRLAKARWLWSQRRPIRGSPAETYLRSRGYHGGLAGTLGFLPGRGDFPPAMIAAFGMPSEIEPGVLTIEDVTGVHLTRIAADGSGKAGTERDKIMIGRSLGWPVVVVPANDLLGLAVTEGIEDALSAHAATGLGAWAAGSASRLPALAPVMPSYIETVSIFVDDDDAGRLHAGELADLLAGRGIEVQRILLASTRAAA